MFQLFGSRFNTSKTLQFINYPLKRFFVKSTQCRLFWTSCRKSRPFWSPSAHYFFYGASKRWRCRKIALWQSIYHIPTVYNVIVLLGNRSRESGVIALKRISCYHRLYMFRGELSIPDQEGGVLDEITMREHGESIEKDYKGNARRVNAKRKKPKI